MFKKKKKEELEVVEATDTNASLENDTKEENEVEETKPQKKNPFTDLGFIFKIFAAAILLALGLWMIFDHSTAEKVIVTTSGAAILILCVARLVYLMRAKNLTKKYKITVICEIVIDLVVGGFLIVAGVFYQKQEAKYEKFVKFVKGNYRWFVGSVIYLRGVVHFFETGFLKYKTNIFNYVVNIALITLGTFCFAYKFDVSKLAWIITVAVLLSCAYLSLDGIKTYVRFKNGGDKGEKRTPKKKDKEKDKESEIPVGILDNPEAEQPMVN